MSKLVGFLARKTKPVAADEPVAIENPLDLDEELFSTLGAQLGGDNEALRNLLLNANHKIGELDSIKDAVGRLVDPMHKALRDFEAEKSDKLNLQAVLGNTRVAYVKLRNEWNELEKKAAVSERECARLRADLEAAQNAARVAETARAEISIDISARRAQIADIETRLKQESAGWKGAREENSRLTDRQNTADKRMVALESELHNVRQKLVLSDDEKRALQASSDKASGEAARLTRRLGEAEATLGTLQTRLRLVEGNLAEVSTERTRLSTTLEELKERQAAELSTQQMRFEAMQARAVATHRLLGEARDQLTARAEETRLYDRNISVLSHEREALAGRVASLENDLLQCESSLGQVELDKEILLERASALAKAYNSKESALSRGEETIAALNARIALLEQQLAASRQGAEQKLEELDAALRREKLERAVVQGALEAGRKDFARLMREVMSIQRKRSEEEPPIEPRAANAA